MRAVLLILLIASLSVVSVPVYAQAGGDVKIELEITPEPIHRQLVYGEIYVINVNVVNLDLDLEEDEVVDPTEPLFKFTGNLVLDTSFKVEKEGSYRLGSETIHYNHSLQQWDKSYDIELPEIDESESQTEIYRAETGYEGDIANLDEWVTFSVDVYVYIEEYRVVGDVKKYYLGDLVDDAHLKFYVVSDEKIDHVQEALVSLYQGVISTRKAVSDIEAELGEELEVDLSGYTIRYNAMKAYVDDGDYVSAMAEYSGYEPTWRDEVIGEIMDSIADAQVQTEEAIQETDDTEEWYEQLLEEYSNQFSELSEDYQALQTEYENFTAAYLAEVEQLTSELSSAKSTNRVYLFALIALAIIFILLVVRMLRKS